MNKKPKNKGGRPKEDVADKVDFEQVERLGGLGMTDVEIGYILGYCEDTINNYKKDERFLRALKDGKAKADGNVVAALYKRAIGYEVEEVTYEAMRLNSTSMPSVETAPVKIKTVVKHIEPNPTAIIFFLKNRMPDRYRDVKADAPGDKPPADQSAKVNQLIADAEKRVKHPNWEDKTCH